MEEEEQSRLKMAIIAGAAEAAKFKEENPNALEDQVINYVTGKTDEILSKIDDPL